MDTRWTPSYAGTARWCCFLVIFVALTSLLPLVIANSFGEHMTYNAALKQPVTVSPREATCRSGDTVTYSRSHTIRCLSGCRPGRNFTAQVRPDTRFPPDVYEMGSDQCHVPENSYDKLQPVMCYMFFRARYNEFFTYSVWINPMETQTEQTVIATDGFQMVIQNGHLEGVVYPTGQLPSNVTTLSTIDRGIWTHIGVRVHPLAEPASGLLDGNVRVAVFVNGAFVPPSLMYTLRHAADHAEPLDPSVPGRSRATPRPVSGTRPTARDVYIGVAHTHIQLVGCEVLKIGVCAQIGYSAAVRMPNSLGYQKQNQAYRKAKQDFLLETDPDDDRLDGIQWDRRLVTLFACAYNFPPCSRNGTAMVPCRALCEAVTESWPASVRRPHIDCEAFPDSSSPDVCVGVDYKPDFRLFEGKVRHGLYHKRLLTNRELEAEYTGRLRPVRPLSECLCDAVNTPAVQANQSLTCVADVPDQYGDTKNSDRLAIPGYGQVKHFVPEFLNDGDTSTAWASATGRSRDEIDVHIDFGRPVQMWVVKLRLESHFPRRGITMMGRRAGKWQLMQYLAVNCVRTWGKVIDGVLAQPDSVNCQNATRLSGGQSAPPYTITLDLREGRPRYYLPSTERRRRDTADDYDVDDDDHDDHITLEEFLTVTAIRVRFNGKPRTGNNHVVSELSVFPRNKCGCYEAGTKQGFHCLDVVCQCRDVAGVNIVKAGPKCRPYLTRMFPSFGPRFGGTKVVIFGGFFGQENTSVSVRTWIEDIIFDTNYSNETSVYVMTPRLTDSPGRRNIMNVPTQLRITLESRYQLVTHEKFIYKENPIIERIEPERSILSGGIVQTVIGRYMDSVAVPFMNVTLVYRGRRYEQQKSVCIVRNSTAILCPTPIIQLPPELNGVVTKRAVSNIAKRTATTAASDGSRSQRDTNSFNSDEMEFYIGLLLDGVPNYRNVSDALPEYGKLAMYKDPKVHEFEDEVMLFRPYSPHNDEHVIIKGERLDMGCSAGDYSVTVGGGKCIVLDLQTNQLVCRPPSTKPALGTYHGDGAPRVKVVVGNINVVVGYLLYEESLTASTAFRDGIIATVCVLLLLLLAALLAVCIYRKRDKLAKHLDRHLRRRRSGNQPSNVYIGLRNNRPSGIIHALDESLALRIEDAKIESWRMKLGRIIGKGNFGEVHVGLLLDSDNAARSQPVAIKTIRDMGSVSSVSEFLEEATVMHNFDHPNVLPLLGVVIANDRPFVIMPLMQNGDLRTFIASPERSFTVRDLLDFGHQVAKGMAYLATQHFIHRDLAARNCMVDQTLKVKIADFGLARDIYNKDYYRAEDQQRPLPVKWMALEALQYSTFTTKSDVWSFGVVLWELMTRGVKPYSDIDNVDLRRFLELGRRLEKPAVTPQCIYDLMKQCWETDPETRPSFAELCKVLDDILSEVINVESPDYANHYMTMVDVVSDRPSSERYQRMSSILSEDHRLSSILSENQRMSNALNEEANSTIDERMPLNTTQEAADE